MVKKLHVHFMGIGGSGISAVARMAQANGFNVSGCDIESSSIAHRLQKEGIPVTTEGHDPSHLRGTDILAHTSAVFYQSEDHPELTKANNPMIWEEFMAKYLQKGKFVIAVAGTHGKGTTTAMLARVLETAGLDPTVEVGANLLDWDRANYRIGKSKYFLCEADEYREKFLLYKPDLLVITSIEMDHPDYFADFGAVLEAFVKMAKQSKTVVINGEDPGCQKLIRVMKTVKSIKIIKFKSLSKTQAKLKLPGDHVRSDAGGVWTAARELKIPEKAIKSGLESFSGLERRFEYRGEADGVIYYDDYAHHPTAVEVNIKAAREMYPKHKIWVVFQPHMYSRLQNLFDDFIKALSMANKVVVTDVYSKREPGVNKPSGKELALAIGAPKATYVGGDLLNVANFVSRNSTKGDVILNMGAGDVYKVSDILLEWR
jgi:UDP-N-acetylmuramate--alanine ligase